MQRVKQSDAALISFERGGEGDGLKMGIRAESVFNQAHAFDEYVVALAARAHAAESFDERVLSAGDLFN